MLSLILANLIAAAIAPALVARARLAAPWILAGVPLGSAAFLLVPALSAGLPIRSQALSWAPQLGAELALRADGLSYLFVALVGLVGGLVVLHAGGYLSRSDQLGRFYLLLFVFITAMFGMVLADNLWALFVCWELTSISSFFLIGFKHEKEYAREAARRALLTTGAGGLAMLAGFALLAGMGRHAGLEGPDAATISLLLEKGPLLVADPRYPAALVLILLGAFTKSAQMPFHHWLPAAMAGPTPVSALLHSATMVKAGIYLLARLNPGLGGTDLWFWCLTGVGTLTMVGGALLAISRTDLKDILAYTTLSALGTLVLLVGLGTPQALAAMVVFLTVHALYKSTLFLVAANVDHRAGTRELNHLGRLGRPMLLTAIAAMLAAMGQAGAPPALGYMGKKLALQAKLDVEGLEGWLILAAVVTNIAMVALALALAWRPFWSRREATPPAGRALTAGMALGPVLLGFLGVGVGLVPRLFDQHLGAAAASAAAGETVDFKLKVWSGLSLESLLLTMTSLVVFALGYVLYRRLEFFQRRPHLPEAIRPWTPTRLHEQTLDRFLTASAQLTAAVQGGRLRHYVAWLAVAAGGGALVWLIPALGRGPSPHLGNLQVHEALLVATMVAGAVGSVRARRPITATLAVGVTGLGLALVFALHGGVDLAITQLLVETLMVVILVSVLSRLPDRGFVGDTQFQPGRLLVASVPGLAAAATVWLAAESHHSRELAEKLLAWSWPEAHGRNVVNVILVDFRALDTLGEVVVVAAAALTVAALVRRRKGEIS